MKENTRCLDDVLPVMVMGTPRVYTANPARLVREGYNRIPKRPYLVKAAARPARWHLRTIIERFLL